MKSLFRRFDFCFIANLPVRWWWLGWFRAGWCSEEQPAAKSFSAKMQQHATTIVMFGRSDVRPCHVVGVLYILLLNHDFWMLMSLKPDGILGSKKAPSSHQSCKLLSISEVEQHTNPTSDAFFCFYFMFVFCSLVCKIVVIYLSLIW